MYQLNIIKKIKKATEKSLWKTSKSFEKRKRKKATILLRTLQNLSEDEKQKLVEYRKKSYRMRKKCFIIIIRNYYFKK